jgi:hypothetical protein
MIDEFEFTLHSPLTKEDWNKLTDAELENTMSVTFQTPSGRQVKYIKCEVIDKIRAEIEQEYNRLSATRADETLEFGECLGLKMALKIINKYKGESEGE